MRDFVEQTHGQMQDVASHRKETRTVYPHDAQRRDDRMNSAAQDYERQLQLLEMQNKQRLDMARSEENQTIAGAPPSRTAYPLLPIRGKPSEVNAQPETAMPDIGPPQTSPAALEAQERRYHQNVLAQQNMKRKFYESQQALATPSPQSRRVLLVWGGSSSVGSCAIQLASFSGVEVYTTASAHNFAYCEKLGAAKCFDYHDPDVEDKIVEALKGKTVAGAYHAVGGNDAVQTCARIMDRASGKAIVVTVRGVPETGIPSSVRVKSISSSTIFQNDVGPYIWRQFLPKALKTGKILPAPAPLIVGEELRSVQHGLDKQKAGVSAAKVVITKIS